MCRSADATDGDGNVVFSVSCCKTFSSQPNAETIITTGITLTLCAEDKLKRVVAP